MHGQRRRRTSDGSSPWASATPSASPSTLTTAKSTPATSAPREIEEIDRFDRSADHALQLRLALLRGRSSASSSSRNSASTSAKRLYAETNRTPTSPPFFYYSHRQTVVPGDECPTRLGLGDLRDLLLRGRTEFPAEYKGALFFADAVRGCIWVMFPGADGQPRPDDDVPLHARGQDLSGGQHRRKDRTATLYYASLFGEEPGPARSTASPTRPARRRRG